mgnify:CR=1 FL=1
MISREAMGRLSMLVLGCLITSMGVLILRHSQVVTGGTAGLSLTLSYLFNAPFAIFFFTTNIPFYLFSFYRMGWRFTATTILSVSLLSLLTGLDRWLPTFSLTTGAGAVTGGILIGFGLSMLFINRASLGGINILALFLQQKKKWNPGTVNFVFDFIIVLLGIYSVGIARGLWSILSIAITSCIISYFKKKIGNNNAPTAQPHPSASEKYA